MGRKAVYNKFIVEKDGKRFECKSAKEVAEMLNCCVNSVYFSAKYNFKLFGYTIQSSKDGE